LGVEHASTEGVKAEGDALYNTEGEVAGRAEASPIHFIGPDSSLAAMPPAALLAVLALAATANAIVLSPLRTDLAPMPRFAPAGRFVPAALPLTRELPPSACRAALSSASMLSQQQSPEELLVTETPMRSFAKAAGWRFTAGIVTACSSYFFTGSLSTAASIVGAQNLGPGVGHMRSAASICVPVVLFFHRSPLNCRLNCQCASPVRGLVALRCSFIARAPRQQGGARTLSPGVGQMRSASATRSGRSGCSVSRRRPSAAVWPSAPVGVPWPMAI
jgi:hypothetical protein